MGSRDARQARLLDALSKLRGQIVAGPERYFPESAAGCFTEANGGIAEALAAIYDIRGNLFGDALRQAWKSRDPVDPKIGRVTIAALADVVWGQVYGLDRLPAPTSIINRLDELIRDIGGPTHPTMGAPISILSNDEILEATKSLPEFTLQCLAANAHVGLLVSVFRQHGKPSRSWFTAAADEYEWLRGNSTTGIASASVIQLLRDAVGLSYPPIRVVRVNAVTAHEAALHQAAAIMCQWFEAFENATAPSVEALRQFRSHCQVSHPSHDDYQDLHGRILQESTAALAFATQVLSPSQNQQPVIIIDEDKLILDTLSENYPAAINQPDLERLTRLPRRTISNRLNWLDSIGYTKRPEGTARMGRGITELGMAAIGKSRGAP